jgi:SAM-dependent methyltransferase
MMAGGCFTARHYIRSIAAMAISDLLADNALVRLVTGRRASRDLAVSMAGIQLGERLLVVGLGDAALLPALAAKTGLTGRACGVDPDAASVEKARLASDRAGVLVEVVPAAPPDLPFSPGDFDIVVIRVGRGLDDEGAVAGAVEAASRVLRGGGRCLVVADRRRRGVMAAALTSARRARLDAAALCRLMTAGGLKGARVLAEREGLVFVEGLKAVR